MLFSEKKYIVFWRAHFLKMTQGNPGMTRFGGAPSWVSVRAKPRPCHLGRAVPRVSTWGLPTPRASPRRVLAARAGRLLGPLWCLPSAVRERVAQEALTRTIRPLSEEAPRNARGRHALRDPLGNPDVGSRASAGPPSTDPARCESGPSEHTHTNAHGRRLGHAEGDVLTSACSDLPRRLPASFPKGPEALLSGSRADEPTALTGCSASSLLNVGPGKGPIFRSLILYRRYFSVCYF